MKEKKNKSQPVCGECGEGVLIECVEDYQTELSDGHILIVPKISFVRCGKCDLKLLPPESWQKVDDAIDEHNDTFKPEEIQAFLNKFGVDQTEAAEALGLGAKTVHRWARGNQRVSRSMGYFLRTIMHKPELFQWVKQRGWHEKTEPGIEETILKDGGYWEYSVSERFSALSAATQRGAFGARKTLTRFESDGSEKSKANKNEQEFNPVLSFQSIQIN
ncbi:type II toxin-antitoxin system MqsA family antitoxin [bacterium]|nr:type II toxin-antitoxin system MqsA family antitoxin [bacterium]